MTDNNQLTRQIVKRLRQLVDPERLAWAKNNYPTALEIIGVTVPNIRPIVKDLTKEFKPAMAEEVIEFAKVLNATRILEAQQIAFEVLDKHKTACQQLTLEDLLILGEGIDNWISVDHFAGLLAGPAWRRGQIADSTIEEWANSGNNWWRRSAVVCTVALNQKARGGSGDPERTLKICRIVVADRDDMVTKALSWALRELAKREPAPVVDFVSKYADTLAPRVTREVRRKIETGRKYS